MKIKTCVLILLIDIGMSMAFAQTDRLVRVVVDEWPPFGGQNLPDQGISLDVIRTALTRANYTVESAIVPWERALKGTLDGDYDALSNLFYDHELAADLTYSDPFYLTEVRFVRRAGTAHRYTNLDSLRNYSIAVGEGYLYEDGFDNADFLNKRFVTTVTQALRMVASGRVDLTLDSVAVIEYIVNVEDSSLKNQIEFIPGVLKRQAMHMAVRNDYVHREALISDFNRELAAMKVDGTLDLLLKKHRYNR
jgi:polar amino acid transport system substrate-binding protein